MNNNATVKVSPTIEPKITLVGLEKTPIVIIDDFALDTTPIIQNGCDSEFSPDKNSYYPGVRSKLPKQYVLDVLTPIYRKLYDIYNIPQHLQLKPLDIYYSLISTPENDLDVLQRMPHFDTSRPFYFAVLHYLNDGEHGSTGLFRHKPTQFERINDNNVDDYFKCAETFLEEHGAPKSKYITTSNSHYELYETIQYKPNRLVIYPGNLLHSTLVNVENDIDANPQTGRLTANIFIEFK